MYEIIFISIENGKGTSPRNFETLRFFQTNLSILQFISWIDICSAKIWNGNMITTVKSSWCITNVVTNFCERSFPQIHANNMNCSPWRMIIFSMKTNNCFCFIPNIFQLIFINIYKYSSFEIWCDRNYTKSRKMNQEDPQNGSSFGIQRTTSIAFSQRFVFRN